MKYINNIMRQSIETVVSMYIWTLKWGSLHDEKWNSRSITTSIKYDLNDEGNDRLIVRRRIIRQYELNISHHQLQPIKMTSCI